VADRLQKVLGHAGVASRRAAEELIRAGRVSVNGAVVRELGRRVEPGRDRIEVDGVAIPVAPLHYLLLHKPRGVVSTLHDPEGRPTVRALLPPGTPRVYPVGRLDINTTGLLLLTNDGPLAERLTHPRHGVPRTYHVKVAGQPETRQLDRVRKGIRLDGERRTAPATVRVLEVLPTKTWLEVTVTEGRHHLVRRLFAAIRHPVEKLARVRLGPLALGSLPPGAARPLTSAEAVTLRRAAGLAPARGMAAARRAGGTRPRTPRRRARSPR
jgi:23S rRNA pseudouridine2605 synthase